MESIVSISNWSYFFINIIEIHFLSFFWERKFYGVMMKSAFISFCSQNLILIYFFFFLSHKNSSEKDSRIFIFKNVDEY